MLKAIYGSDVDFSQIPDSVRVEFSTHPEECGTRSARFLIWDCYEVAPQQSSSRLVWPNSFSEWLGDKCFGLLVAWSLGFRVPKTLTTIRELSQKLYVSFGACRFEWAWKDGDSWLLQVNPLAIDTSNTTLATQIRPNYIEFDPDTGLEELDRAINLARSEDRDIFIIKQIGITSHVCELLNAAKIRFTIASMPHRN